MFQIRSASDKDGCVHVYMGRADSLAGNQKLATSAQLHALTEQGTAAKRMTGKGRYYFQESTQVFWVSPCAICTLQKSPQSHSRNHWPFISSKPIGYNTGLPTPAPDDIMCFVGGADTCSATDACLHADTLVAYTLLLLMYLEPTCSVPKCGS